MTPLNVLLRGGAAIVFASVVAADPPDKQPRSEEPTELETTAAGLGALCTDLQAVAEYLDEHTSGGLSKQQRKSVVERVLEDLGYSRPAPPSDKSDDPASTESETDGTPRVVALNDWCLYAWLPHLSSGALDTVGNLLEAERKKQDASWFLLDLRSCAGDEPVDGLDSFVRQLAQGQGPLVVLVGCQTGGGAQNLLRTAQSAGGVVTIGESVRGTICGWRTLDLPSGIVVTVPDFEEPEGDLDAPLPEPDIGVSPVGRVVPPEIDRNGDRHRKELRQDPAVRRALDALTAVRAFAEPHF